ncbi:MAG TPA: GNAT family N-acetyltransferase [Streptomyces sp.]|uniref:GNAT family N-acetyltransferase n=1 Tax=Streptomyces sp. TaxID=1931 RepID=UPI002D469593|nr:GNAT family N-acetyltransferase [Streptomyces sp.]HZG03648.1 GNAT family N-acetyltransferase [Streptomyces sp.]
MGQVEVRSAVVSEASAVSRVMADSLRDSYLELLGKAEVERLVSRYCSLSRIRTEIGAPGSGPGWQGWLVAVEPDGQVLGVAAGGVAEAGAGEVYCLCVTAERRREGIGSALLAALSEQQYGAGAHHQWISLHSPRDPALPFLERHGFRPAKESSGSARYVRAF